VKCSGRLHALGGDLGQYALKLKAPAALILINAAPFTSAVRVPADCPPALKSVSARR
jgi:hypothetical protein